AGDLAMSRYELDDAIVLFEQAVAQHPDPSEEVQLWRSVGRAHALRYDGLGLWNAMQRAIELCTDRSLLGELYAELSVQAATRSGIWAHLPEIGLVQEWIDRALALAPPGSAARARALIALCFWRPERPSWAVEELDELTRALGDPWLRILALISASFQEFANGRYAEAMGIARQAYELEAGISDPNVTAELRETSVTLFTLAGRPDETRRLIAEYDEASERLSPHHRMHGVAMAIELEEITGDWEAVRALTPKTRTAVAENLATPCVRNSRSLLVCAAACAALGDDEQSRALEGDAEALVGTGYEAILAAARIRLARGRGYLDRLRDLLVEPRIERGSMWWYPAAVTSYLDAVATLRDREPVEREAPRFLDSRSALEPFALRALG